MPFGAKQKKKFNNKNDNCFNKKLFDEVKKKCIKLDKVTFGYAKNTMLSIFLAAYEPDFVWKSTMLCCI